MPTSSDSPARRRPLAAVLLVVATLLGLALVAPPAHAVPPRDVTVMTYNIFHGVGQDGRLDLPRIAAEITAAGAEIVGLQEVDNGWGARSDFADQAAELARLTGMRHVYGANLDQPPAEPGQPRRQYGTAILSAHPIVEWANTPLPNLGGEQRGLLEALVRVRGQELRVYNTHLQHDSAAERAAQADAIVEHIAATTEPFVVIGDLNAVPGAAELAPLLSRLTDAWAAAGDGDGFTIPVDEPNRRIDYVLASQGVEVTDARVVRTLASDHLPVVADVTVTGDRLDATPLPAAHAHNDYEHPRPLLDALERGFTSVEADLWLVDGELLVAHDAEDLDPERTFAALYLDPLADLVRRHGGTVFPGSDAQVQLLVDIKTDGPSTYAAIHEALTPHRQMLTTTTTTPSRTRERDGAVEVVISGNRPRELMAAQRIRYAGYDGRLADLGAPRDADFMPLVSDNWGNHFAWRGDGPMPAADAARLAAIVEAAHAQGQRVRFWNTPDAPGPARDALWAALLDAGVDHLNTDDLAGLQAFLLDRP